MNIKSLRPSVRLPSYAPIDSTIELLFDAGQCLNSSFPFISCDQCVTACPVQAIELNPSQTPKLNTSKCIDCGQCQTACPTQAFSHPKLSLNNKELASLNPDQTLYITCNKSTFKNPNTWQTSCLKALSTGHLLTLSQRFPKVVLVKNSDCIKCGSNIPSPGDSYQQAKMWLEYFKQSHKISTLYTQDQGLKKRHKLSDHPESISRRALFRNLVQRTHTPQNYAPTTRPGHDKRHQNIEQIELINQLSLLSKQTQQPLPEKLLPNLSVSDACCNQQVCQSVCPTGAIFNYQADDSTGLVFDATRCIECNACEQFCPDKNITLYATHGRLQPKALTRHTLTSCFKCGTSFSHDQQANKDSKICPTCQKENQLLDIFATGSLF